MVLQNLESQGTTPDVLDFLKSVPQDKIHLYILNVKKNPKITLQELQNSTVKPKQKELTPVEKNLFDSFDKGEFSRWAVYQFRKLTKQNRRVQFYEFSQIYDFFRNVKLDNPRFSLNEHSFDRAKLESEEWHNMIAGQGSGLHYTPFKRNSKGEIDDPSIVYTFDDGWFIVKLNNENDMMVEGNKVHHCVGGSDYCHKMKYKEGHFYSLRDPHNDPHATIELGQDDSTILQIKSFSNEPPERGEKYKIGEFLKDHGAEWSENSYEEPEVEWYAYDLRSLVSYIYQEAHGVGEEYFAEMDGYSGNSDFHQDYGIEGTKYNPKDIQDVDINDCYNNVLKSMQKESASFKIPYADRNWNNSKYKLFDSEMKEVIDALIDVAFTADIALMKDHLNGENARYYRNRSWRNYSNVFDLIENVQDKFEDEDPEFLKEEIEYGKMPYTFDYELLKSIEEEFYKNKEYLNLYKKITESRHLPILDFDFEDGNRQIFDRRHPRLFYTDEEPGQYVVQPSGLSGWTKFHPYSEEDKWKYPIYAKAIINKCAELDSKGQYILADALLRNVIGQNFAR